MEVRLKLRHRIKVFPNVKKTKIHSRKGVGIHSESTPGETLTMDSVSGGQHWPGLEKLLGQTVGRTAPSIRLLAMQGLWAMVGIFS